MKKTWFCLGRRSEADAVRVGGRRRVHRRARERANKREGEGEAEAEAEGEAEGEAGIFN